MLSKLWHYRWFAMDHSMAAAFHSRSSPLLQNSILPVRKLPIGEPSMTTSKTQTVRTESMSL